MMHAIAAKDIDFEANRLGFESRLQCLSILTPLQVTQYSESPSFQIVILMSQEIAINVT